MVEYCGHIAGVTGSNPVSPTNRRGGEVTGPNPVLPTEEKIFNKEERKDGRAPKDRDL